MGGDQLGDEEAAHELRQGTVDPTRLLTRFRSEQVQASPAESTPVTSRGRSPPSTWQWHGRGRRCAAQRPWRRARSPLL